MASVDSHCRLVKFACPPPRPPNPRPPAPRPLPGSDELDVGAARLDAGATQLGAGTNFGALERGCSNLLFGARFRPSCVALSALWFRPLLTAAPPLLRQRAASNRAADVSEEEASFWPLAQAGCVRVPTWCAVSSEIAKLSKRSVVGDSVRLIVLA